MQTVTVDAIKSRSKLKSGQVQRNLLIKFQQTCRNGGRKQVFETQNYLSMTCIHMSTKKWREKNKFLKN